MVLSAAGNGVEDLLVPLRCLRDRWWLLVECKVPRYELTASTAVRYTKAQIEWRALTAGWPRITATSAQNAVDQIRELTDAPDACRVCGCTEDDCSQCVKKTGEPCSWVAPGLCSACDAGVDEDAHRGFGGTALVRAAPVAQATRGGNFAPSQRKANQMAKTTRTTRSRKAAPAKPKKSKGRSAPSKGAAKPKARAAKPRKARGAAASAES
jgi:hypothetical protein